MYPERDIELAHLAEGVQKFGAIKLSSITYGSKMQSRGIRSSKILASWPDNGQVLQDRYVIILGIQFSWEVSIYHISSPVSDGIYRMRNPLLYMATQSWSIKTNSIQEDRQHLYQAKGCFQDSPQLKWM